MQSGDNNIIAIESQSCDPQPGKQGIHKASIYSEHNIILNASPTFIYVYHYVR